MARTRSRTIQRTRQRRGFKIPTMKTVKSALRKRSKIFLIGMIVFLLGKVPKKVKINAMARIDRSRPKRSRKRRVKARKSRRRKATRRKTRQKTKRSKASIRAQRLRNLKKARAAKKRKR